MKVKPQIVVAALAIALLAVSPAGSAPGTPVPVLPASGTVVDALPTFGWNPVTGAARYEFELAGDPGFNSPLATIFSRNTRATVKEAVPNGTYYWHVRAVDSVGGVSAWSETRFVVKSWTAAPTPTSPANGAALAYPTQPLTLKWTAVSRASKYLVWIATDDQLSNLIIGNPEEDTQAIEYTPDGVLAPGTYYWAVTPVDARGNRGTRSPVWSFTRTWNSATTPVLTDLASDPELFDPQFSWTAVPGAERYEVEVNSSSDFATGSRVCCNGTALGTSLSPTEVFGNNNYYWRVRAFDPFGNAGQWNVWNGGAPFTKSFDNVTPSIANLHMRDNLTDPGTDVQPGVAGYQTNVPIVAWDPVPGATSYQVEVTPWSSAITDCNWSASSTVRWASTTATTSWTPLADGWNGVKPYSPSGGSPSVSFDSPGLILDQEYCVRVRARSGHNSSSVSVFGPYTYLNGSGNVAFQFVGFPAGGTCTPSCTNNYLGSGDYVLPLTGSTVGRMPLLTWRPLAGKSSYFVLIARDPEFTNIEDYALTQVPAYAPRKGTGLKTYSDETTAYYWVILPAVGLTGETAVGDPNSGAPQNFLKQTTAPTQLSPGNGAVLSGQPAFRWTPTEGARRYNLQVASDPTFSAASLIDNVTTASTAYSSNSTYQADTVLYWRVRADDATPTGLTWSATRTFQKTLPAPVLDAGNPTTGDFIPTIAWAPVEGASSYFVHVELPDGTDRNFDDVYSTAFTAVLMTGVGVFSYDVRANFPTEFSSIYTRGPVSTTGSFTRTIREPQAPASEAGQDRLSLSWNPKPSVKDYRVQISQRADFSPAIETTTTDHTSYAPPMTSSFYAAGGTFYWRVAARDEDSNLGDWTPTHTFSLPPLSNTSSGGTGGGGTTTPTTRSFALSSTGRLVRRQYRTVTIYVRNTNATPVYQASVRASGAGITVRTKTTSTTGVVKFRLRPTLLKRVTFRVSKTGYYTKYLYKRVYAR
jgi:hypothetical protein